MGTRKKSRIFFVSQKSKISVKYENLRDKKIYKIVSEELKRFNKLVEGHRKLLIAIGNL